MDAIPKSLTFDDALLAPRASDRTAAGADIAKLLTIGTLLICFFFIGGYYTFPGGAAHFTQYADVLAHGGHLPQRIAQRDIGFPFLLWITLYPYTGSFIGITLLQAVFALLIPILIYLTIGAQYPRAAFYTAIAAIASFAPYQFIKWIHHDDAYLFFTVLTLYYGAMFLRSKKPRLIYWMTFAIIATGLTRPAGNWMFPPLLLSLLWLEPRQWRHYALCTIIFVLTCYAYHLHRLAIFDVKPGEPIPSYTGEQVFYNLYINSHQMGITLSPDLGPNMQALTERLRKGVGPEPMKSGFIKDLIGGEHYSQEFIRETYDYPDTDSFVRNFYEHPNYEYSELLDTIAQDDDHLFLMASWEIARAYPFYVVEYVTRNLYHMLFLPGYSHGRDTLVPEERAKPQLLMSGGGVWGSYGVADEGVRELSHVPLEHELSWLHYPFRWLTMAWRVYYLAIVYLSLAAMLAAPIAAAWDRIRSGTPWKAHSNLLGPFLLSLIILLYNATVTAALADPVYRYHYFIILPQIVCAGFGGILLWKIANKNNSVIENPPANEPALAISSAIKRPILIFGALLAVWVAFLLSFY